MYHGNSRFYYKEQPAAECFYRIISFCVQNRTQHKMESCIMSYRAVNRIRAFRPDPARKLSANLYDIYHCCMYSEKLPTMDRGTVRNM